MTATITVLAEKGSPLSHTEMDNNFRALRNLVEVPTAAALRTLGVGAIPAGSGTVITQGCLAAGDGGGGVWRWDSASSATDNTGTVLLPTGHVGNGRWLRVYDKTLDAAWFGIQPDTGADLRATLQTALNAATAGQTLELVRPGLYLLDSDGGYGNSVAVRVPVGVNLRTGPGVWLSSTSALMGLIAPLGSNVLEVNIDGRAVPNDGVNGTWTRWIDGICSHWDVNTGIGATDVTVRNSTITGCYYGIMIEAGAQRWNVHDNHFYQLKQTAVMFGAGVLDAAPHTNYPCLRNRVCHNHMEDLGDIAVAFVTWNGSEPFSPSEIAYNLVLGNIAKNCQIRTSGYAFDIEPSFETPSPHHDNAFIGNVYENTNTDALVPALGFYGRGGINVSTTRRSIVANNTIKLTYAYGADHGVNVTNAESCLIEGNSISTTKGRGINADGSTNITIADNTLHNCGWNTSTYPAICMGSAWDVDGLTVRGNTISYDADHHAYYGAGAAAMTAVVASGKTIKNLVIENNTIRNPIDRGISLLGRADSPILNVRIAGNSIIGTGDATLFQREGIYVYALQDFVVTHNTVYQSLRGLGIESCSKGTITHNLHHGSTTLTYGLSLTGSSQLDLKDNAWRMGGMTAVLNSGTATVITTPANAITARGDRGIVFNAKGETSAIATGATVTHGLAVTPTHVQITPADTGVTDWYVSALGATTFTINYSGGGTHAFYWEAKF